ncbi:MAG: phosphatidylinositol-specific phospholipase C1-like protein [Terracidiphilus sp.]
MLSIQNIAVCALVLSIGPPPCAIAQTSPNDTVRMNQIQVIGTHNSYHAGIAPSEAKLMQAQNPKRYEALEYKHRPLDQQLSSGIRQIELDVYADSQGGRYAHPAGPRFVAAAGLPPDPDFDPQGLMNKPGFKVMHVQDWDYRSVCQPFTACLQIVRKWSLAHPGHLPVYILVETKQTDLPAQYHAEKTEKFTSSTFDALDAEIRSVFKPREMITPDDVRGKHKTLEEAVLSNGWPTLAAARGKVVFLMDQRPVGPVYLKGHPSLRGRAIFTNAQPGEPDCAFIEENDGTPEVISALVQEGYLIRTRTDEETVEARTNQTAKRDASLASGAQILSTDYPASEPASWSGYSVSLPRDAIARCNPVIKPISCDDATLEEPDRH